MQGRGRGRPRHPGVLTPGEERVLEEVRNKGGTNAEIAARLDLSPETVKTHIARMLSKLDLPNRRALAAWRPGGGDGWRPLVVRAAPEAARRMGQAAVIIALGLVLVLVFARSDEGTLVAVPPDDDISLSAGPWNTCAIRGSGELVCWGANRYGEASPPRGTFRSVSVGSGHSCGLRESGEVACWGRNDDGQADAPVGAFRSVSAGDDHSCAVRDSGAATCWGDGGFGRTEAPDPGAFSSVSAGSYHSCGVRESGEVACWGAGGPRAAETPARLTRHWS